MRKTMRDQRKRTFLSAAAAAAALAGAAALQTPSTVHAAAANFEWVGGDTVSPTSWDLTSLNWNDLTTPAPGVAWSNNVDPLTPNAAFFPLAATPGVITVNAGIDLSVLNFSTGAWTIAGGTGDLSFGSAGGNIAISTVNDNSIAATIVDRTAATSISVGGAGTITLTGINTYSGGTTLNAGGIVAIDDLVRVGSGNIDFNGGWLRVLGTTLTSVDGRIAPTETTARFMIDDAANVFTMNAALAAGTGVLFVQGPGTLVVSGQNLNTGATDVSAGATMRIAGGDNRLNPVANLGIYEGSTLDLNGFNQEAGKLDSNSASVVITNTAAGTLSSLTIGGLAGATYEGQVNDGAGVVALVKNGTATQTMLGTSTYSGGTTINAGTLSVNSNAALGAATGGITLNGGTLSSTSGFALGADRDLALGVAGGTLSNAAVDTILSVDGIVSGGDLTRTTAAGAVALNNSNTYTGTTTINGVLSSTGDDATSLRGGVIVRANDALGTTAGGTTINANGWLGFDGGVNYSSAEPVTIAAAGQITGSLRSISGNNTFAGPITAGAVAMNIGVDADSLRLTGALSGTAGLNKVGAGTLILDTPQAYTGTTTVRIQNDSGAGRAVTTPGGTLKLEGPATLAGAVTLGADGTLLVDSSTTAGATRSVGLNMGNDARLTIAGNAANATTDSFGNLALNNGGGEVTVEINPGAAQTATAAFGTFTRDNLQNASSAGATINFRGPNFGTGVGADEARATFTTNPGAGGGALRYITITDTVTGRTTLAANGTSGIRQLLDSEYNLGTATGGGVFNNGNARLTGGTTTITADAALNTLSLAGDNITVDGAFALRAATSQSFLLSTGAGNQINTTNVDFGTLNGTTNEGLIYVEGDLTINGAIRNNGTAATMALTKAGPGELVLAGDNTFTTTEVTANRLLRINNGTVSFSSTGVDANGVANGSERHLGTSDPTTGAPGGRISIFSGGTLRLKGEDLGTVFVPQIISIGNANVTAVDGETAAIHVDAGSTLKTPVLLQRSGNGAGGFTKRGAGTLLISGSAVSGDRAGTGKSFLAEGTITLAGDATNLGGLQTTGWMVMSPGTTINIDSTARPTSTGTRLGAVQLTGSQLNVIGNNANATTDQVGTFVVEAGGSEVNVTQGTGQTTTLNLSNTAGSVRRRQGGTLVISGVGLGTAATGVVRVTGSGNFNGANVGGVIPWALADTTVGGPGAAFAVYGSQGITPVTSNTAAIASGGNVRLSSSDAGAGTVNSLHIDGNELSAGGSGTLNVTSGGILSTGGANSIGASTLNFGTREGIIHTVTNLSVSGAITGSAGLTKAGPNLLTLAGDNTYSGGTHINDGYVMIANSAGSATGSGFVSINRGTLTGSGAIAGVVTASRDAEIAPGVTGIGGINVGGLTLEPGSLLYLDVAAPGNSDLINITGGAGALTLNGGSVELNDVGGLAAGSYTLIDYNTAFNGALANLGTPTGPAGFNYALVDNTDNTTIQLIVSPIGPVESIWNKDDSTSLWSDSASWIGGVPNAADAIARFGSVITAPQTVNVDGVRTVGAMSFDNANSYTLASAAGGGGSIVIDRALAIAEITVLNGSHAITAPVTLNKETTVTVTGETNTLTVSSLQPSTVNLTKQGGGTLLVNNVRGNDLTVTTGTLKMIADSSAAGVSKVAALTIGPEGKLDLNANKLLTSTPVGTFNGTAYDGVQGEVARAYNFGAWDMPGLTTSQPNAGQNTGVLSGTTTIAVATAEQVMFIGATDTALFQGQTVTGATTIAMYTYAGDLNMDGLVDGADYGVIDNSVQFPGTSGYANGDFNYDGVIDGADYGIIDNTIQLQGDPFPGVVFGASSSATSASLSGVTAVPEPSACGFALLGAGAFLARRRRRRHPQ